ncbi:tRNA lysidine(34) synthetase TilS [Halobacteriovorax marinus]|uniref:tRNA lysidine(34) synthetase TilS n=1 Tax=Halobacteriovorax marinus TaxID=97084 RepID=UPI000BC31A75|nr:tRNA lysidine(34) synthetase TilS [Halobacteriovorax marinus]ATH07962.1 tRNA lysidine(34) synthetase TilS [Halobacteriovorax marinus]
MKSLDSVRERYCRSVFSHLYKFMNSAGHLERESICVALSGGVDSVTLLYCLKWIEQNFNGPHISAHHINHGTRKENIREEDFCRELCRELKVPLKVSKVSLDLLSTNFEMKARELRYAKFKNELAPQSFMALAQHIDDSYEWSLMQSFRSATPSTSLGIPVCNGSFIRPFMCLTKGQIKTLAKKLELTWCEDDSNANERFDRNYIRKNITASIADRYPKYLKHYVNRSNSLAKTLGLSIFKAKKSSKKILKKSWKGRGVCFISRDFKSSFEVDRSEVLKAIYSLSKNSRGILHDQVDKFLALGRNGKTGPLIFSGGVWGYSSKGCLFLLGEEGLEFYKDYDLELLSKLKNNNKVSQIPNVELKNKIFYATDSFWPFLAFGPAANEKTLKSLKKAHPLLPLSTQYCLDNGIWFQSLSKILDISHKNLKFYL